MAQPRFGNMDMMRTTDSVWWHALHEEHAVLLGIAGPKDVAQPFERGHESGAGLGKRTDPDENIDDGLRRHPGDGSTAKMFKPRNEVRIKRGKENSCFPGERRGPAPVVFYKLDPIIYAGTCRDDRCQA